MSFPWWAVDPQAALTWRQSWPCCANANSACTNDGRLSCLRPTSTHESPATFGEQTRLVPARPGVVPRLLRSYPRFCSQSVASVRAAPCGPIIAPLSQTGNHTLYLRTGRKPGPQHGICTRQCAPRTDQTTSCVQGRARGGGSTRWDHHRSETRHSGDASAWC
jgi:hypothetical protein